MKDLFKAAIQTLIELLLSIVVLIFSIFLTDKIGNITVIIIAIIALLSYNYIYYKKK